MSELYHLRREFELYRLDDDPVLQDPVQLFEVWLDEAVKSGEPEPNAMVLATVGSDGQPSSRIVLLKAVDEKGFTFFTNYESRKASEISNNSKVSLLFFWPFTQRQVRIEGVALKVPESLSDHYFLSRPEGSRISAVASPQSEIVTSRRELEQLYFDVHNQPELYGRRPQYWGGYVVKPVAVEFWQGRENRLHDRIRYTDPADGWTINRLAP